MRPTHPRKLEVVARTSNGVIVRFPEGAARHFTWQNLAYLCVQAIREPSSIQELPAATLRRIVGEQRWMEALDTVTYLDTTMQA